MAKKSKKKELLKAPAPAKKEKPEKVGKTLNERQKRFCNYYLGIGHKGTFGNATASYWDAYIEERKIESVNKVGEIIQTSPVEKNPVTGAYTSEYSTARTNGNLLLTNPHIQAHLKALVKNVDIEFEMGTVVKQNDSLPAKVQAGTLLAKITGKLKENTQVDIPGLTVLADGIKSILGSLKK